MPLTLTATILASLPAFQFVLQQKALPFFKYQAGPFSHTGPARVKNPTSATTAADMPGSSERLKHSADVGGGEMKAGVGERCEGGVDWLRSSRVFL